MKMHHSINWYVMKMKFCPADLYPSKRHALLWGDDWVILTVAHIALNMAGLKFDPKKKRRGYFVIIYNYNTHTKNGFTTGLTDLPDRVRTVGAADVQS
jgi:hypothetical protein